MAASIASVRGLAGLGLPRSPALSRTATHSGEALCLEGRLRRVLFLPRSAGPASSRAMATSAVEVVTPENFQSDQWEAMVKYQLGAWHGRWDTVSTDGQLISTRKSITGLRRKDAKTYHHVNTYFEEDGTSKDFDFGTHTADKPFRAQLVGPVFVFGPGVRDGMVLGEIGLRHGDLRQRVVFHYGGDTPSFQKLTVIREQLNAFQAGTCVPTALEGDPSPVPAGFKATQHLRMPRCEMKILELGLNPEEQLDEISPKPGQVLLTREGGLTVLAPSTMPAVGDPVEWVVQWRASECRDQKSETIPSAVYRVTVTFASPEVAEEVQEDSVVGRRFPKDVDVRVFSPISQSS